MKFIFYVLLFISLASALEGPENLDFRASMKDAEFTYTDKDESEYGLQYTYNNTEIKLKMKQTWADYFSYSLLAYNLT